MSFSTSMAWQWYQRALTNQPLTTKAVTAAALMSVSDTLCQLYEQAGYRSILHEYSYFVDPSSSNSNKDDNDIIAASAVNLQRGCPTNTECQPDNSPSSFRDDNLQLLQYDKSRTLQVGLTGLTFAGPISHAWYGILESTVARFSLMLTAAPTGASLVLLKLVLDALVFSPVAVAGYFVWRTLLEHAPQMLRLSTQKHTTSILDQLQWKLEHKWWPALQASWSFWPFANVINFGLVALPYRVLYNNCLSVGWNAYLSSFNQRRLQSVVAEKQSTVVMAHDNDEDAKHYVNKKHASPATTASNTPCVCPHCRALRG